MDINSFVIGFKKGKASGGGGGGSLEGFHMVRFFNDDQTTLLYTVYVPTGASAMYAGETPTSTVPADMVFVGFEPAATNITADLDCYAVYEETITTLDKTRWAKISELSANGEAQNYFSVGDRKNIHIEGVIGTLTVDGDFHAYIIGFDHNEDLEGKGIHFGTFKTTGGRNVCLIDENYQATDITGKKWFNHNHWGDFNYGGWAGCDLRYDILGSTDVPPSGYGTTVTTSRVGYDASETCATKPVANTLMAALPADLRAVMKPMTKYADGKGNMSNTEAAVVATIDYLPLLAEFEVMGERKNANEYEQNKQAQYVYYAMGNTKIKYKHTGTAEAAWHLRSAVYSVDYALCTMHATASTPSYYSTKKSCGLAPIFKV